MSACADDCGENFFGTDHFAMAGIAVAGIVMFDLVKIKPIDLLTKEPPP
jgi:hypothetical protein